MDIIGVDIDNVLASTDAKIRELIFLRYGVSSTQEQILNWDYHLSLPITAEQEKLILEEFHRHHCQDLDVIPGAKEAIESITGFANVWLLTQRPGFTREPTEQWLATKGIPFHRLIFTHDKTLFAKSLLLHVDDDGKIALAFQVLGLPVLLMDYPWNRNVGHTPNIMRVYSWKDILGIIESRMLSPDR